MDEAGGRVRVQRVEGLLGREGGLHRGRGRGREGLGYGGGLHRFLPLLGVWGGGGAGPDGPGGPPSGAEAESGGRRGPGRLGGPLGRGLRAGTRRRRGRRRGGPAGLGRHGRLRRPSGRGPRTGALADAGAALGCRSRTGRGPGLGRGFGARPRPRPGRRPGRGAGLGWGGDLAARPRGRRRPRPGVGPAVGLGLDPGPRPRTGRGGVLHRVRCGRREVGGGGRECVLGGAQELGVRLSLSAAWLRAAGFPGTDRGPCDADRVGHVFLAQAQGLAQSAPLLRRRQRDGIGCTPTRRTHGRLPPAELLRAEKYINVS